MYHVSDLSTQFACDRGFDGEGFILTFALLCKAIYWAFQLPQATEGAILL